MPQPAIAVQIMCTPGPARTRSAQDCQNPAQSESWCICAPPAPYKTFSTISKHKPITEHTSNPCHGRESWVNAKQMTKTPSVFTISSGYAPPQEAADARLEV